MRIGLIGHNSVEYTEKLLQIWHGNNSAVLIDCDAPPSAAFSMLADSGVTDCFLEDSLSGIYGPDISSLNVQSYSVNKNMPCVLPKSVRDMFKPRYDESEAVIVYSSGTTGKHKGISLSHRAINNNADSVIDYMKPSEFDCLYLNNKLTHCSSLVGELLVSLKSGADILLAPVIIPPRIAFKYIKEFKVTVQDKFFSQKYLHNRSNLIRRSK